ncbi:MAG: secretion system X translation initiation factor [Nitrosomonadaceae bacterium]|jgi:hypothetical protein|nr:secretion system X translation initiation factor [Nitrosospira sp.]MDW7597635.1 secretion system X translation initiation factor [Nitrosomonadaceae bacterium]MBI0411370.1 secretion system X translation initiation factor [Nitrosospira sp.]MDW7619215.1 secretion system X translation initiation factor [Nitrosomonadaceae bacterium]MDW7647248.1 secretion system X translation initiation factor [Nitrosomonadaceae bacterium]
MKRAEKERTLLLGGALLATFLTAQWMSGEDAGADPGQPAAEEQAPSRESGINVRENEIRRLELGRLERRKFSAQAGDIFSRKSWAPPPPSPKESGPPPPPPLLFKYLGKVMEGEETRVFLSLSDRNYIVKQGESIDNRYRVDEVNEQMITFTYLPLGAKQTLFIADGAAGNIQ